MTTRREQGYLRPELLVDTKWLEEHLTDPKVRVVDMGSFNGYLRAHIPGALHPGPEQANYLKDSKDPLHVMPPAEFSALMRSWGIGDETTVVAYDADGGHNAARIWWVLRYYGSNNGRLLNGGWNNWMAESRPVSMDIPAYPPRAFTGRPQEGIIATVEDMKRLAGTGDATLVDVRAREEYEGTEARGNRRTGRIPGAVHMEWREAVQKDSPKRFRSAGELTKTLESKGISKGKPVVTYCQAGVRAAHGAFTLHLMGYDHVRVYDGSFAEWGNRDDTQIEK